jgi:hypothetical protein
MSFSGTATRKFPTGLRCSLNSVCLLDEAANSQQQQMSILLLLEARYAAVN